MKIFGRFLILWPLAVVFGGMGYTYWTLDMQDKIAVGSLFAAVISIFVGIAILRSVG